MIKETCGIFLVSNDKILCCLPFGSRIGEKLSIPKGLKNDGEKPFEAALREFEEETGYSLINKIIELQTENKEVEIKTLPQSKYRNNEKVLVSFVVKITEDLTNEKLVCNSYFYKEGKEYPEIAEFYWFTFSEAKNKLHPTQAKLIDLI